MKIKNNELPEDEEMRAYRLKKGCEKGAAQGLKTGMGLKSYGIIGVIMYLIC